MNPLSIECDVHFTRDGHVVVIHDPNVDRTTNGAGTVADLTLAELQRLDAGFREVDGIEVHPDVRPRHALEHIRAHLRMERRAVVVLENKRDVRVGVGEPREIGADDLARDG